MLRDLKKTASEQECEAAARSAWLGAQIVAEAEGGRLPGFDSLPKRERTALVRAVRPLVEGMARVILKTGKK